MKSYFARNNDKLFESVIKGNFGFRNKRYFSSQSCFSIPYTNQLKY